MQKAEKHFTQQQLFSLIVPTFYTGFTIVIGRRPFILLKTPWYVLFRLQRTVFLVTYYYVVFDFITKPAWKCLIRYFYTDKHICNYECAAWKTIQLKREKIVWAGYLDLIVMSYRWSNLHLENTVQSTNLTCN